MANKLGDRSTRPHRAPHNKFSSGQHARAISDRSGLEFPYQEMVFEWNGSFVHNSEFEPKQPQLDLTYSNKHNISTNWFNTSCWNSTSKHKFVIN